MKRIGRVWGKICEQSNIEYSVNYVIKRKLSKVGGNFDKLPYDYRYVYEHMEETIEFVRTHLVNRDYDFGKVRNFKRKEGRKVRDIHHLGVIGNIYCQCVLSVMVEPIKNYYIEDTFSSISGRGLFGAIPKIQRAFSDNRYTYAFQADIKKCYDNIDHSIMMDEMRHYIKDIYVLEFIERLISLLENGIAIGFSPDHYLVNLMMTRLCHIMKEKYGYKYFFEYMDDFLFVLKTKEDCFVAKDRLSEELKNLGLTMKNTWRIAPLSYGFDYCGYVFYPGYTKLRKTIKINMKRKANKLRDVSDDVYKQQMASYYGWCIHADCKNLMKHVFGDRLKLFDKCDMKSFSEIHTKHKTEFGLPWTNRHNQTDLVGKTLCIYDIIEVDSENEYKKFAIKFKFDETDEEYRWFYTSYQAIWDRLNKHKFDMPFSATIKKKRNWLEIV